MEHVFFLGVVFLREALFDLRKAWSGLRLQLGSLLLHRTVKCTGFSPETNSKNPWKLMVGRRSFHFGAFRPIFKVLLLFVLGTVHVVFSMFFLLVPWFLPNHFFDIWGYLPNGSRVGRSLSLRCWRRLVSPMRKWLGEMTFVGECPGDGGWRRHDSWVLVSSVFSIFTPIPGEMIQFDDLIFFKWVGSTTT